MPVPLSYTEIAQDITDRIERGEYPPGSKLPSYSALAELYSINRSTAFRVYALLRDRGTVISAAGRGMYVPDAE